MKRMNVIVVFDKDIKNVLMCKRAKDPYKGLYNLVGGKIEDDNSLEEAYRELLEETAISKKDISIEHFMDLTYIKWDMELEVYYGVLKHDVTLVEEVNKLEWISLEENFFDMNKFAGEGNIGHMIKEIMIDMEK
jgi:8-oxo-dGTP diphosphatase